MEVPSDMIEFQQSVTHIDSFVHNAPHYTIHYICSQSSPYPSVTLYRSTWPAVCLLFTLPMIPSCYYEEDEGKSFKITVGDEYAMQRSSRSHSFSDSLDVIPACSMKEPFGVNSLKGSMSIAKSSSALTPDGMMSVGEYVAVNDFMKTSANPSMGVAINDSMGVSIHDSLNLPIHDSMSIPITDSILLNNSSRISSSLFLIDRKGTPLHSAHPQKGYASSLPPPLVIYFHYKVEEPTSEVFLVGSFNDWNTTRDRMFPRKTDDGTTIFELYLELYSGLYYYKFYLPESNQYVVDPLNSNHVSDTYGSFNSVLEIPVLLFP